MITRPILLLIALSATLSLTSCATNTDEAYTKCTDHALAQLDEAAMTPEEFADQAVVAADDCQAAAEANPASFNQQWNQQR